MSLSLPHQRDDGVGQTLSKLRQSASAARRRECLSPLPFKARRMTPLVAYRRNQRGGLQTLHGVCDLLASFSLMGILLREKYRHDPVWYFAPVLVT